MLSTTVVTYSSSLSATSPLHSPETTFAQLISPSSENFAKIPEILSKVPQFTIPPDFKHGREYFKFPVFCTPPEMYG
jgi:hypothetical protein